MDPVILDTDVFSFLFKRDTRGRLYEADTQGRQLCLCFQTVAEINAWAIERKWSKARCESLQTVLQHYLILPYDAMMAETWARITVARRRLGKPIGCGDCWIAPAAVRHGLSLLTHNAGDYVDIPALKVITHPG